MSAAQKRVAGAFLVGAGLIAAAWYFSRPPMMPSEANLAVVTSESAPRGYITVTDEDNDGIPDWQEALQRTEPLVIEPVVEYEPPDTLTGEFALRFFEDMMLSEHYNTFNGDPNKLAELAVEDLGHLAKDTLYTKEDIVIIPDNSKAAIRTYANAMATIVLNQTVPEGISSELEILKRAYDTNDPEVLRDLRPLIESYEEVIADVKSTPVPAKYADLHLDALNVFNAVYNNILAMEFAFSDPLKTVIRLKRYEEDATSLQVVLLNLQKQIVDEKIEFEATDPVWQLTTP